MNLIPSQVFFLQLLHQNKIFENSYYQEGQVDK